MAFDPSKYAGAGTENLDESSSMPLLALAQAMSPELKRNDDKYIEGLQIGDIFLKSTGQIIQQPLEVVPVAVKTIYVEWRPKSQGGGIVGMHGPEITQDPTYEQGRKGKATGTKTYDEWLGENELKYTAYWYCKANIEGEQTDVVISLSSTGLRVHRKLNNDIRKFRYEGIDTPPPLFARKWELVSSEDSSPSGDYFTWQFQNPTVLDFEEDEETLSLCGEAYEGAGLMLPSEDKPTAPALTADDDDVVDAEVF